jgi:hypothetical protein
MLPSRYRRPIPGRPAVIRAGPARTTSSGPRSRAYAACGLPRGRHPVGGRPRKAAVAASGRPPRPRSGESTVGGGHRRGRAPSGESTVGGGHRRGARARGRDGRGRTVNRAGPARVRKVTDTWGGMPRTPRSVRRPRPRRRRAVSHRRSTRPRRRPSVIAPAADRSRRPAVAPGAGRRRGARPRSPRRSRAGGMPGWLDLSPRRDPRHGPP